MPATRTTSVVSAAGAPCTRTVWTTKSGERSRKAKAPVTSARTAQGIRRSRSQSASARRSPRMARQLREGRRRCIGRAGERRETVAARGGVRRRALRSSILGIVPCPDELHLALQADSGPLLNGLPDLSRQQVEVRRAGVPLVNEEVGVLGGHLRLAVGQPFQPGCLNQAAGEVAIRVLKEGAGTRVVERLGRGALLQPACHLRQ